VHASGNYQASYSTIAYTDPFSLIGASLGFLSNHASKNALDFNTYSQPETGNFGYVTPLQFPFIS
jgi:hypothetical protein